MENPILDTIKRSYNATDIGSFDPSCLVDDLFVDLNPREREVLKRRYGIGENKTTLERIGNDFGVTRERVRQIEIGSIKKLKKIERFNDLIKEASVVLSQIIAEHGGIMQQDHLLEVFDAHEGQGSKKGALLFILSKILNEDFDYVSKHEHLLDAWKLKQTEEDSSVKRVKQLLSLIEKHNEPLHEDKLMESYHDYIDEEDPLMKEEKIFLSHLRLSKFISQNIFGHWGRHDWNTIKPKRMNDKIYIVLKQKAEPLHFSKIASLINEMKFDNKIAYPATVHNELILDKKYVLVGRGIYALSDWGYKHGVVADVIEDILKEFPELTRDEIVEKVLNQRIVGKSTVHLSLMDKKRFRKNDAGCYILVK